MNSTPQVQLKPQREVAVQRRHPWIFSGAVDRVSGRPGLGDLVSVHDSDGDFLAWGHYSPESQIRVRLISWSPRSDPTSKDFWRARLEAAITGRRPLLADGDTNACRLVNAESDGIPGLIVDKYTDTLVVQYLSAGVEARRELFNSLLMWLLKPRSLFERSDVDVREKEGLPARVGLVEGEEPPEYVEIQENNLSFAVDVRQGHKTGFYLDQRENRARLYVETARRATLQEAPRVLNAFAYTGAFGIYALTAGAASVTNVDSSADVLKLGWTNRARNGFAHADVEDVEGDAFEVLRAMREQERHFDIAVLDPPKFAHSKRDVQRAARGYKDINMQALHLLDDNGLLFTFSCSGVVSADLFQKIVFSAALDAGRRAQIVGRLTQSNDHPVSLMFPEGQYLSGLICRVTR
jgi:23S rRNA (cytosine1962-C5)-methyltransferase